MVRKSFVPAFFCSLRLFAIAARRYVSGLSRVPVMTKLVLALFLVLPAGGAFAADAWDCRFPGHAGIWQVDGGELVAPASSGATRFPIVRNTSNAVVALAEELSDGRFEMVMVDRRSLSIKILLLGLDANNEQHEEGICSLPGVRAIAAAQANMGNIRHLIRDLVRQARSLADRGYTASAALKLTEAAGLEHITPDETQLITQTRQYVTAKQRR
jgi:hypothetical protein